MKKSSKVILLFLSVILMNSLVFEQTVLADVASPMEGLKQPGMLIFLGVVLVIICGIVIYNIISVKRNK